MLSYEAKYTEIEEQNNNEKIHIEKKK